MLASVLVLTKHTHIGSRRRTTSPGLWGGNTHLLLKTTKKEGKKYITVTLQKVTQTFSRRKKSREDESEKAS